MKSDVATPVVPVIEDKTATTVTLAVTEGYEYSIDGITWQSSNVFENLDPATEYKFYQRIAETATSNASPASEAVKVTTEKTKVDAPSAPVVGSKTANSVTLVATAGYEYSKDGTTWQPSNVFENLNPATEYTFYQRIAETATSNASPASEGLAVTTPKSDVVAPIAPVVETKTANSVTLVETQGYEYSKDGTTWQPSNVFENLNPATEYTFYQRIAETATTNASPASEGFKVTTLTNIKKGDVTGDGGIKLDDAMKTFLYVAGNAKLEGDSAKAADVNDDGEIKLDDAMKIFQVVAGKKPENDWK